LQEEVEAESTLHGANVGLENTKNNRQSSSTMNSIRRKRILILMTMLVLPDSIQIEQMNARTSYSSKISVHPICIAQLLPSPGRLEFV
jgi:hypothetical protein